MKSATKPATPISWSCATCGASSLDSHLNHQDWSPLARQMVSAHLAAAGTDLKTYTPIFNNAVELNARSMILAMTVPFALLLPVAFMSRHRPLMTHVVFALHQYTFLLIMFSAGLLFARASGWLGFGGMDSARVDHLLSGTMLVLCACYLYLAIGKVYDASGIFRVLQAGVLAIAVGAIVLGYRLSLFFITLYMT